MRPSKFFQFLLNTPEAATRDLLNRRSINTIERIVNPSHHLPDAGRYADALDVGYSSILTALMQRYTSAPLSTAEMLELEQALSYLPPTALLPKTYTLLLSDLDQWVTLILSYKASLLSSVLRTLCFIPLIDVAVSWTTLQRLEKHGSEAVAEATRLLVRRLRDLCTTQPTCEQKSQFFDTLLALRQIRDRCQPAEDSSYLEAARHVCSVVDTEVSYPQHKYELYKSLLSVFWYLDKPSVRQESVELFLLTLGKMAETVPYCSSREVLEFLPFAQGQDINNCLFILKVCGCDPHKAVEATLSMIGLSEPMKTLYTFYLCVRGERP